MAEEFNEELPADPYSIITIRWKMDGPVIVDVRGVDAGMAHMMLQKACDAIFNDFTDPIVFYEDSDVVSDEQLESLGSFDDDDE